MSDPFNEALGIEDVPIVRGELVEQPPEEISRDYDYARANIYSTIETCQKALIDLATLAESAQNARVYEVLSTLAKTLVDANQQLLALQKQKKELQLSAADVPGDTTINNNLILTTAEFSRMLNKAIDSNE